MSEFGDLGSSGGRQMANREAVLPLFRLRTATDFLRVLDTSDAVTTAPAFRPSVMAFLAAICYYAGSQIGFSFTPTDTPIATFWPPNAILLGALLLTPARVWGILVFAVLPAHLLVQLKAGIPLITALSWFVGNTGEALLGAVLVRVFKKDKQPLFETVHGVIVFLTFGVLLPVLGTSFLDAAGVILTGLGQNYWMLWTTRLTSNLMSSIIIVPAIVIFGSKGFSRLRKASIPAFSEVAALTAAAAVVSFVVFGKESPAGSLWTFLYLLLPLLIWTLLRSGSGGAIASILAVALISVWDTMHGRGPLGLQTMAYAVLSLHFVLTVLAASFLLSGALMAEKRHSEETLHSKCGNLVHAQEEERYRIARELHDNILQRLTLLNLHLDELRAASLVFAKSPLNNLYEQVSDISKTVRDLSHDLHPFMLEYLGLPRALRKLCKDAGIRSGATIEFSEQDVTSLVPSDVSGCLFRVAQEALENIVRHSHAQSVAMELKVTGRAAVLRISEDGVGIQPGSCEGAGLTQMCEQVLALAGIFEITSSHSKGTVIKVSIPVKTESAASAPRLN